MTIWLNKKPERIIKEVRVVANGHGHGTSKWELQQLDDLIRDANQALQGFGLKLTTDHACTNQCPYCKYTDTVIAMLEFCCDDAVQRCPKGCQMPMDYMDENSVKCSVCGHVKELS